MVAFGGELLFCAAVPQSRMSSRDRRSGEGQSRSSHKLASSSEAAERERYSLASVEKYLGAQIPMLLVFVFKVEGDCEGKTGRVWMERTAERALQR